MRHVLAPVFAVCSIAWVPSPAWAQGRPVAFASEVWSGWSAGVSLGRSGNEDDHHDTGDRGRDLRANVEVPLGKRLAARAEVGRVSWRYQRYGPLHQSRDDVVSVHRASLSLLAMTDPEAPVRGYIGGGIGLYRWGARVGTIAAAVQRGATLMMGVAVPVRSREWAITGDMQANVMPSPNESGRPAPDSPVAANAVYSLTFSIGVRKYF